MKIEFHIVALLAALLVLFGFPSGMQGQQFAVKSNLVGDAFSSPNLGAELKLGGRATLDVTAHYFPFYRKESASRNRHWLLRPELRFWRCEPFSGWFWGIHLLAGEYNLSARKLPFGLYKGIRSGRYEGSVLGGGMSLGYQWVLSPHWGVEAGLGAGYVHAGYSRYYCAHCGEKTAGGTKHYLGPTKVAVSLVYVIR